MERTSKEEKRNTKLKTQNKIHKNNFFFKRKKVLTKIGKKIELNILWAYLFTIFYNEEKIQSYTLVISCSCFDILSNNGDLPNYW